MIKILQAQVKVLDEKGHITNLTEKDVEIKIKGVQETPKKENPPTPKKDTTKKSTKK